MKARRVKTGCTSDDTTRHQRNLTSTILMLSVMCALIGGLVGCGGAQAARDKLSRVDSLLSSTRKLKCPHRSIGLAERAYTRSR